MPQTPTELAIKIRDLLIESAALMDEARLMGMRIEFSVGENSSGKTVLLKYEARAPLDLSKPST